MTTFNKTLLALVVALSFAFVSLDKKACKIYNKHLTVIEACVQNKAGINVGEIIEAINFFERITSIKSESGGDYIGRYRPTKNDYDRWSAWYDKNEERLYYDSSKGEVVLRN